MMPDDATDVDNVLTVVRPNKLNVTSVSERRDNHLASASIPSNMADNGLFVTVSGTALSLLLYENVRSVGDQIGFLIGEVVVFVTKSVTDADRQIEVFTTHINVTTVVTCSANNIFCNAKGELVDERLRDFIKNKGKSIVGWFHFRRDGSLTPTLRDKLLHKEFMSALSLSGTKNLEYFTMCLLNTSVSNRGGTHKFRHVFLRYKDGIFEPISLRINNLGDDSSRPDGSDYKPTPVGNPSSKSNAFTKILKSFSFDTATVSGTELVTQIQKSAEHYLDILIPKVSASDLQVASLEKQVEELQAQIFMKKLAKKFEKTESSNGNSNYQRNKNTDEARRKLEESKLSAHRLKKDLIDIFNDNTKSRFDEPTRQFSNSMKQKSLVIQSQPSVIVAPKNINDQRPAVTMTKITRTIKANTSSVSDPFASVVADMKMDMTENSSSRNRRSQSKELRSSPEVVCLADMDEPASSGIGRGYGRGTARHCSVGSDSPDVNYGSRKARRGRPKNFSEKLCASNSPNDRERSNAIPKSELVSTLSYSQAARKFTDSSSPLSSESQEY